MFAKNSRCKSCLRLFALAADLVKGKCIECRDVCGICSQEKISPATSFASVCQGCDKTLAAFCKDNSLVCIECDQKLSRRETFKNHVAGVHLRIKKFSCKHCDFKCADKGNLQRHSCYARAKHAEGIMRRDEKYYQDLLAKFIGGKSVKLTLGVCDILADNMLIEIKCAENIQKAIGQLVFYSLDHPAKLKIIIYFGQRLAGEADIAEACSRVGIIMTHVSDW